MGKKYDAIIIGSGQAGKPLAMELANRGQHTLLIEKEHVGGTCINRGCTPTKTMVASAKIAYEAKKAHSYGVELKFQKVDLAAVKKRKQNVVESFRKSSIERIKATPHLELVYGTARFMTPYSLEVQTSKGKQTVEGTTFFINTGGKPLIPKIEGIEAISYLDSTTIMELEEVPEHLMVIGGGYISLEFAQMFRRFGSRVTILQRGDQLLSREDSDIAQTMEQILSEEGIEIRLNTQVEKLSSASQKTIQVHINSAGKKESITGSHLLIATGRAPVTEDLHVEAAGVILDQKGFIPVNDALQTNVSHIYALGDVKGGPAFTHISYDDYRVIRDNLFSEKKRSFKERYIPYTVFTDPQLGRIGLSEQEAIKRGIPYKLAKIPMSYVARAIEVGDTRGLIKALIHKETGQILGCAVLGIEGGELMAMIEIAMMGKLTYTQLADAIFAHPTLAESLNTLFTL